MRATNRVGFAAGWTLLGAALLASGCGGGGGGGSAPVASLAVTGMSIDGSVRYAVTLEREEDVDHSNVVVEVTLPAGASFVSASETPDRSVFLGQSGDRLTWA